MPNAPRSKFPKGKPGADPRFHPMGTFYVDREQVRVTGERRTRRDELEVRLADGRWVKAARVLKQPQPPRTQKPFTKRQRLGA